MLLSEVLKQVPMAVPFDRDVEIRKIEFDSRKVEEGDLFVATVGTVADGHDYIEKAVGRGAVAVVCQKMPSERDGGAEYVVVGDSAEALGVMASNYYGNPSSRLKLVGVTGTNGKTTIATLLYNLFMRLGHRSGLLSTVCNYVDSVAVPSTHTTPDALELNGLLARMVDAGCEYAFMEVSSHSVDQRRIAGLKFCGGVFTNLTRDHLDYHKTVANYLKAKKRFFDDLPKEAFAVTNLDDKNGLVMLQNTHSRRFTYSIRSVADFKARLVEETFEGMQLQVDGRDVFVPFVGRFNASNLMAVFSVAVLLGVDEAEALRVISTLRSVSGRFETVHSPKGFAAIVDYAHTPDALTNVINTINDIRGAGSRLITVVGCGGNRDRGKRPIMAQEAVRGSDTVVLTSDNPRNEDPQVILDDMLSGLTKAEQGQTLVIADRRQAIRTACRLAQKGDVVLVAGKGHEDYQIIGDVKHHFDDMEEICACF